MDVIDRPTTAVLRDELATYEKHRDELLGRAEGKYVLIKGEDIAGEFESKMDAVMIGYQRYGNVPFLVKHVVRVETPLRFVGNNIAP